MYFARKLKERAEKLKVSIRHKHERDLAELHKKQERERHELQMRQSKESQTEARAFKEGRDKGIFRAEQRGKLRHELGETKREVTQSNAPKKSTSLTERFARLSPNQSNEAGRAQELKGQNKDNPKRPETNKAKAPSRESTSLAEKFRRAQERGVGAKNAKGPFKDNARDVGREHTKKPPK